MNVKVTIAAAIAVVFCFGGVNAKTLRNADEPAEFPSSSYSGKQYVDSLGCVYIRAGIDGNVTWVPRVSRSRTVVCGFKPTNAGTALAKPAAKTVTRIEVPKANAQSAVKIAKAPIVRRKAPVLRAAPKPVVRRVVSTPKPIVRTIAPRAVPRRVAIATTQNPVVRRAIPIAAVPIAKTQTAPATRQASSCRGASVISQQYIGRSSPGLPVRCGPQPRTVYAPNTAIRPAPVAVATSVARVATRQAVRVPVSAVPTTRRAGHINGNTRIVPRHVYEMQLATNAVKAPPRGYKSAWSDDRLNPRRAQQTVRGVAQMDLVWTQEVPRRLINAATGKDVTRRFPTLIYPYIDIDDQLRYRGTNSTIGQTTRRAVLRTAMVRASTKSIAPKSQIHVRRRQPAATTTRSVAASGHKYVQVGTFGVAANANQSAARLRGLGLPVRTGTLKRGGESYRVVLAGPFGNSSQLSAALRKVRGAGFSDAFLR